MIVPPTGVRVLIATKPVDFRKGMDGLAAYVEQELQVDPFSGIVYVFRAKRADSRPLPGYARRTRDCRSRMNAMAAQPQ